MNELIPRGSLIVSCQARADNPLHGATFMGAMALAAAQFAERIKADLAKYSAIAKSVGMKID